MIFTGDNIQEKWMDEIKDMCTGHILICIRDNPPFDYGLEIRQSQTKAEKNQARLKHLRGRAGRWA